mgnify:CR=1 FL=1
MAHKFIYENTYEGQLATKVEFTIPSDADLSDMCEEFTNYLKAVGYSIPEGNYLDFVNDEETPQNPWTDYFNESQVTKDFSPRDTEYGNYGENNPPLKDDGYDEAQEDWSKNHVSINDATPQEWDNAYKNVSVTYNGS